MELAQKVEVLVQTVSGLVVVNERLVGLLADVFGLAAERGKETVKFGEGGKRYVC